MFRIIKSRTVTILFFPALFRISQIFYDIDFKRKNKLYIILNTKNYFKETVPFTSEIGKTVTSDVESYGEVRILTLG